MYSGAMIHRQCRHQQYIITAFISKNQATKFYIHTIQRYKKSLAVCIHE